MHACLPGVSILLYARWLDCLSRVISSQIIMFSPHGVVEEAECIGC